MAIIRRETWKMKMKIITFKELGEFFLLSFKYMVWDAFEGLTWRRIFVIILPSTAAG